MESHSQLIKQDGTQDPVCHIVKSPGENAQLFAGLLNRLSGDLEAAIPMAKQLFYDFSHLKKGEQIMGCRTQDEWAQRYAKRTARALRYMFDGGNPGTHHETKSVGFGQKQDGNPFRFANSEEDGTKSKIHGYSKIIKLSDPTPIVVPIATEPYPLLHDDSELQKLRASLVAERTLVQDLKRLVKLVLGDEGNLWHLSDETRRLYERLM